MVIKGKVSVEWVEIEKLPNGVRFQKRVDGKLTNSYKLELLFDDPVFDVQVEANSDDAIEIESSGAVYLQYYLWRSNPDAGSRYWSGARWTGVTIPQGSTIDVAYMEVYFDISVNNDLKADLHFEDADNPETFTTNVNNIQNRARTVTSVLWNLVDSAQETWHQSPSLVIPLQAVVNRGGFAGNAVVVIGKPYSDVDRYWGALGRDDDSTKGAKLHIEYTEVGGGWTGKISGVTNPAKVMGVDVANIAKVKGVA